MSKDNSSSLNDQMISVSQVRPSPKEGATVAFADGRIGAVTILGISVVKNKSGGFFASLPVRFGKTGKAFPLMEIDEPYRTELFKKVMAAATDLGLIGN